MAITAGVTTGLELDDVECSPLGDDKLVIRLYGRWSGRRRRNARRVTLVVEDDGRRHRFQSIPQPRSARPSEPDAWTASFAIPAWLRPKVESSMSLSIGDTSVPVPAPKNTAPDGEEASVAPPPPAGNSASHPDDDESDPTTQSAPPASSSDATIAALRAELHERAGAVARLHGVIADVQAEVEASASAQSRLQATHDALRGELEELRRALEAERTDRAETESRALREREELQHELSTLRTDLATSEVAREAALSEAAGLRAEVERLGRELVDAREHVGDPSAGLAQAEALLAEARALTASPRDE